MHALPESVCFEKQSTEFSTRKSNICGILSTSSSFYLQNERQKVNLKVLLTSLPLPSE